MIDKEKKEYLQNKIGQKLTTEEEKTLNSLLYDKFSIDLNSVQVLAGSSLDNYERDLLANSKLSKYDIIEKTNISLLLENCILPKNNTDSPQCKINGTLPKLVLNFTDEKYLIFKNTLSNVLSLFSRDDITPIENNSLAKPSFFDILSDDIFSKIADDDEFFDAKEESNENIKNEIELFSISDLEFNFNIKEIIAKVGKYDKTINIDKTIANMVLLNTNFILIKRLFDTKIIAKIENIFIEDNAQELNSEFRKILVASEPDSKSPISREKSLISIEYFDVNPSSPEYRGIGRRIDFNLAALDLFISNSNVMEIYDFLMKTFVNNSDDDNSPNEVVINSNIDSNEGDVNTTLIGINMKGVNLIANNGKYRISTCNIHTGEIMIYTQQRKLYVTGQLEDILIVDNIKRVETGRHYYQLLSTKGNKALDFKYIKYDPKDKENYPGYDMSLYLRADSVHYTHLNPLINDLYEFFNEMRELYETAKDKAIQSASQIKENTSKIVVDIDIQTPIIEFPKGSLQSKDHLIVYLGEINMRNESFSLSPQSIDSSKSMENQNLIPNKFNLDINSMKAVSHYYFGDNEQVLQILKDFNIKLNITLGDLIRDDDVPRIKIISNVTDINIQLTEKQYLHILELYHTIFKINDNNTQVNNINSNNSYIKNEDNLIKSISHSNLNLNPTINCEILKSKSSINSDFSNSNLDLSYKKSFYMKLNVPLIKLETFLGDGNGVSNLKEIGHTSLQIYKSQVNVVMSSNNNIDIKVGITSFTMNDICLSHKCVFREIIPVQSSEKRFANVYFRRDSNKNSFLDVEINNPKIIFALNTLFELKNFFFNPLNISISSIQENVLSEKTFDNKNTLNILDQNNDGFAEDDYIFYNIKTKDKMNEKSYY
ncbi:hypothetical protein PIROE2DRAFT_4106 [Piromyces sp. E2]|nr:hypothetical protein PIROE2DRAFT_4106 [Piromyces sp. E2]|eukprot:OUM68228.1 hypothetical protein PIROE2DRAFT_4106 [Piromyces sp. E2]